MVEPTPADASQPPPYFEILFSRLRAGEPATTTAFGRHVHWGYWPEPGRADGSPEDYAEAAERLCALVCEAAGIRDGMRVLDVGCGYGGTVASLNERFRDLELVGVNIDPRQLERARQTVRPKSGNTIRFVEGDACRLDFAPGSFDVVLAVECIFHFPSRADFFAGAGLALSPGGRMALSDFVPPEEALPLLEKYSPARDEAMRVTYGQIDVTCALSRYRELADRAGLQLHAASNVSKHTLPTYPFLRKHLRTWPNAAHARLYDRATARMEMACNTGLLDYHILSFRKLAQSVSLAA
jgi:cyclopropane fatty-acyl-phospholipid synthase-like methyltransferase